MVLDMPQAGPPRLERSCAPPAADRIWFAPPRPGLERAEVRLQRQAYRPHRHDTYALGCTLRGVQAFRYRGEAAQCLPGQVFVLHPDELHDGRAGGAGGFAYRILYIAPELIGEALGPGRPALPFVADAVSRQPALIAAILAACRDFAAPLDDLESDRIVADLAEALAAADRSLPARPPGPASLAAARRARERIDAGADGPIAARELEAASGLSRYQLARHFRAAFGTSPHRYHLLRRLDRARASIEQGRPLAEAALAAGFADQSHLTRQFARAYGLAPGRWRALRRAA